MAAKGNAANAKLNKEHAAHVSPFEKRQTSKMRRAAAKAEVSVLDDDTSTCRTCGDVYNAFGDGYAGECSNCADRRYFEEDVA
jgi:hypothetical protein